jgi:coenzyme PQQ precursor peptide PqqA
MTEQKKVWTSPTFDVTATGFEVTMYLGTQTVTR